MTGEQLMLLAQTASGAPAAVALVHRILEAPGVYAFGEFLQLPCIQELSKGPNEGYYQLLNMFAYGTFHDYKALETTLPALSPAQRDKLRHLTVVSLARNMQTLSYSVLLSELALGSVRELEDVLIAALDAQVLRGKLDQAGRRLEVDGCVGRDLPPEGVARIAHTLEQWCGSCEKVCVSIEEEVGRVSRVRLDLLKALEDIQTEVGNLRRQCQATPSCSRQDTPPSPGGEQDGEGGAAGGSGSGPEQRRPSPIKMLCKSKNLASPKL